MSRPSRRKGRITGRSEGSHFADARRRSIQSEAAKQPLQSSTMSPVSNKSSVDEGTIITRRRSVIPPVVNVTAFAKSPIAAPPLRKRTSDYTDGSPAPRYSQVPEKSSSALHSHLFGGEEADGNAGILTNLNDFAQVGTSKSPQVLGKTLPTAEVGLTGFQLSQPKRVRQRKSFLGSFQKRNSGFDTALPPFNHADDDITAPDTGLSLGATPSIAVEQHKTRTFSDTLKGRLKKVFGKTSKTSMPIQHVHAKSFHFSVRDNEVSEATLIDYTDPFMTVAAEQPRQQQHRFTTIQSAASDAMDSTSRSRVTSWANSTLATSSVRNNNGPLTVANDPLEPGLAAAKLDGGDASFSAEPQTLKRSGSTNTLRKASSFFARPVRDKLRRTSRTDLKGSEESQGLYSALQRRMRASRSTETANGTTTSVMQDSVASQRKDVSSALSTLPSQRDYSSSSALFSTMSSQKKTQGRERW